jgi:hypothetical protein
LILPEIPVRVIGVNHLDDTRIQVKPSLNNSTFQVILALALNTAQRIWMTGDKLRYLQPTA